MGPAGLSERALVALRTSKLSKNCGFARSRRPFSARCARRKGPSWPPGGGGVAAPRRPPPLATCLPIGTCEPVSCSSILYLYPTKKVNWPLTNVYEFTYIFYQTPQHTLSQNCFTNIPVARDKKCLSKNWWFLPIFAPITNFGNLFLYRYLDSINLRGSEYRLNIENQAIKSRYLLVLAKRCRFAMSTVWIPQSITFDLCD